MWTEEVKGGIKYRAWVINPLTGKDEKVSVTLKGKQTKKQEKLAAEILEKKKEMKLRPVSKSLTLRQVAERYYADQKRTVKEQTYIRNKFAVESNLKMLGEDVLIDRLTSSHVRERYNLSGKGNGTLNEHMVRLKAFLRWAYRNDYVEDISWLEKLVPYENQEKEEELEDKYLESEQLERLLNGMEVKKWRDLTLFLALTGMRCGEAIGLMADDVDIENRNIRVWETYSTITKKLGTTKTKHRRDVYMQDELLVLCKRLSLERKKKDMATGVRSPYFFHDASGEPYEYYAYNKYLKENALVILPEREHKTTTHIMRHTHVALMAENGVSLDAISRRVGHKDSRVTRDIYFHVTKKLKKRDNAEFEKVALIAN